jgi:TM2 domain-containing membrane protein YozV
MSFDTYKDNNEDNNQGKSPYGTPAPAPQANQNPSPYGFPSTPPANQNPSPYGAPAGHAQGQGGNPDAPWGPAQSNPHAQQSPYAFNSAPQSPYNAPQPAPAGGFNIFGLTWAKNVVPNPATGGMAPASQKSNVLAYVLWFFLGALGVHQFYLGNTNRGLFNLALMGATFVLGLTGIPFGLIYTAYWIYEAVTLNDQTNEVNSGYIRKSIL